MPNIILPVKPTYQSVARYAAHNVVENIKRMTGIGDQVPVYYATSDGQFIQPGSAVGENTKDVLFTNDERLNIFVQESYLEDAIINTPVYQEEERLAFEDIDLGVGVKPIYSATDTVITVNFKAKNRLETEAWRDMIKVKLGNNWQSHLHELDFHYPVPKECLIVLYEIHKLREQVAGYGETLGQWLKKCFTKEATTLTTMKGSEPILVIRQKQIGIQGWFEFVEPVEANKDDDGPAWSISFTYRFNYQKPVAVAFKYPVMIHNQLIAKQFFSRTPAYGLETRPHYSGKFLTAAEAVDPNRQLAESTIGGVRVPRWDEWLPAQIPVNTSTVLTVLTQLTPGDLHDVCSLRDMEWTWQPAFEAFFKREAPYVNRRGDSIIYVNLYVDYIPMDDVCCVVNDELQVTAIHPLDIRRTYRVRVSLVNDIRKLSERALQSLMANGLVALLIFKTLDHHLDMVEGQKHILADGSLRRSYIERFFIQFRDRYYKGTWDGPGIRDAGGRDVENHRITYTTIVAKRNKESE